MGLPHDRISVQALKGHQTGRGKIVARPTLGDDRLRTGLNDWPNGVRGDRHGSFRWRPRKRQRGISFWPSTYPRKNSKCRARQGGGTGLTPWTCRAEGINPSFRRATLCDAHHIACATRALLLGPAAVRFVAEAHQRSPRFSPLRKEPGLSLCAQGAELPETAKRLLALPRSGSEQASITFSWP
jgi:hypothetical protein